MSELQAPKRPCSGLRTKLNELLSESKEPNVNFQDLESFLADPNPHDLMRIRPRHPSGHFMPLHAWFTCPPYGQNQPSDPTKLGNV